MFKLYSRLKAVKAKMKGVNKDIYGCIAQKVLVARQNLEAIQMRLMQKHREVGLRTSEQECLHEFIAIQKAEEAFMKQKARNKLLTLGDHNSRFFHCQVKARQARNAIKCLIDSESNRLDSPDQIKTEVISFYQHLLGISNAVNEGDMMNIVSTLMENSISDADKDLLVRDVFEIEIKNTMFSLGSEKAPGPDGFTACFFKKAWPIVGSDVCSTVKSFFHSGSLLKEVNSTIITLVPKVPNPSSITEFRPIACCNVLYKCITKILANRFRSCLSDLISSNQTAFVKGRIISENILLA
jgi:hypothetical protein